MKKYRLFLLFFCLSCSSQESLIDKIKGNWKPSQEKEKFDEYFEMFFSYDRVFYYTGDGLLSTRFKIEGNNYYLIDLKTDKFRKRGEISVTKDTLHLKTNNNSVKYYRIKDKINIEKLVNEEISEKKFPSHFNKRLLDW